MKNGATRIFVAQSSTVLIAVRHSAMGLEKRGKNGCLYYYDAKRVRGKVVKKYLFSGAFAQWTCYARDRSRHELHCQRAAIKRMHEEQRECDRQFESPVDAICQERYSLASLIL